MTGHLVYVTLPCTLLDSERLPSRTITVYTFLQVSAQLAEVEGVRAGHLHHVEQGVHVQHQQGKGAGHGLR